MQWIGKQFAELSVEELYTVLRLRSDIFVVEQNCVFLDMDNKDQASYHLMGWENDHLVAYARIVPAGICYVESSIGRIVTSRSARREGYGRTLVQQGIETLYTLHGNRDIRIGAQYYLNQFYESFGFRQIGDVYLADGIEPI